MSNKVLRTLKPVAMVMGFFGLLLLIHPTKAAAAGDTCSYDGQYVNVLVRVKIVDSNGKFVKWSDTFSFNVTAAANKDGNPSPDNDYPKKYWPSNREDHAIRNADGDNKGPSENITANAARTHSCKVKSSDDGGVPTYDFTNSSNGNYLLDCLGGLTHGDDNKGNHWSNPEYSAKYTFTPISPGEGLSTANGDWVGSTSKTFKPTNSTDLNYAGPLAVEFTFKLDPTNAAPKGSISYACNDDGTATVRYRFSDAQSIAANGWTNAYTHIYPASTAITAEVASDATLQKYNWVGHGHVTPAEQAADSAKAREDVSAATADGGYKAWLYVQDVGGDGQYHRVDDDGMVIGPCDNEPTLNAVSTSCTVISGKASDSDSPGTQLRIDVYEGAPASKTAAGAYPDRQYSTYTSGTGHTFSINMNDIITGNTRSNGAYTGPKPGGATPGGANAHPGDSVAWTSRQFYIYAIGVNNSGVDYDSTMVVRSAGPCAQLSCNSAPLGTMTVGVPKQLQVSAHTTASGAPPSPPKFNIVVKDASGVVQTLSPPSPVAYGSYGGTNDVYSVTTAFTPQTAGNYSLAWNWTYPGIPTVTNAACPDGGTAGYAPYFNVLGGDISAGPGFGTACKAGVNSSTDTPGIYGNNLDNANGAGYYGAGAQLAALALGNISSFTSSQNADGSNAGAGLPNNLTLAHSGTSGTLYGGNYAKGDWCVPDYVASATNDNNTPVSLPVAADGSIQIDDVALTSGTTYVRGSADSRQPLTIHGGTIPQGKKLVIVVYGDVYIDGNIAYEGGSYATTDKIPQLQLLVSGNISVASAQNAGVQKLQGFYAAQPHGSSNEGGNIYTCANGMNNPVTDASAVTVCDSKLTVYGGVAAGKIVLGRTHGNLATVPGKVTNEPAESFIFTPELWLGSLTGAGQTCSNKNDQSNCTYNAFTSLPPVL